MMWHFSDLEGDRWASVTVPKLCIRLPLSTLVKQEFFPRTCRIKSLDAIFQQKKITNLINLERHGNGLRCLFSYTNLRVSIFKCLTIVIQQLINKTL